MLGVAQELEDGKGTSSVDEGKEGSHWNHITSKIKELDKPSASMSMEAQRRLPEVHFVPW